MTAISQSTRLTMDEAVLGQFRQFAPENRTALQFMPSSEKYVFVKDSTLMIGDTKAKESAWLTLAKLRGFKGAPAMKSIPSFTWINENSAYILAADNFYYQVNFKD